MAQIHGRNSVLHVWDAAGASQNVTGDLTSITLSYTRDNPVVSTFGDTATGRIDGLRDATLNGAIVWNGNVGATCLLVSLLNASTVNIVRWMPGGSTTGCPFYTACMLLNSYEENSTMDGAVTATFAFQLASGSVTASIV